MAAEYLPLIDISGASVRFCDDTVLSSLQYVHTPWDSISKRNTGMTRTGFHISVCLMCELKGYGYAIVDK